jgi:hypothetical protein
LGVRDPRPTDRRPSVIAGNRPHRFDRHIRHRTGRTRLISAISGLAQAPKCRPR